MTPPDSARPSLSQCQDPPTHLQPFPKIAIFVSRQVYLKKVKHPLLQQSTQTFCKMTTVMDKYPNNQPQKSV